MAHNIKALMPFNIQTCNWSPGKVTQVIGTDFHPLYFTLPALSHAWHMILVFVTGFKPGAFLIHTRWTQDIVIITLPSIVTCLELKWVISINVWNRLYYGCEDGWCDVLTTSIQSWSENHQMSKHWIIPGILASSFRHPSSVQCFCWSRTN